jgi:hypothetical protein
LDEPTSALDKDNQAAVVRSVQAVKGKKLIIMVTHNIEVGRGGEGGGAEGSGDEDVGLHFGCEWGGCGGGWDTRPAACEKWIVRAVLVDDVGKCAVKAFVHLCMTDQPNNMM